jgi:hypothetical protein
MQQGVETFDMVEVWTRIVENLGDRLAGPISFRFILQPVVAAIFAIVSGLEDAKLGRTPYLWAIVTEPANRAALIKDGWTRIGKVFLVALALDLIYQIVVLQVYPGEALIVAFLLAVIPYVILRGLVNRTAGILGRGRHV